VARAQKEKKRDWHWGYERTRGGLKWFLSFA
jgi:hypothetical protein